MLPLFICHLLLQVSRAPMTFGLGCLDLFGHTTDSGTNVDLETDRGKLNPKLSSRRVSRGQCKAKQYHFPYITRPLRAIMSTPPTASGSRPRMGSTPGRQPIPVMTENWDEDFEFPTLALPKSRNTSETRVGSCESCGRLGRGWMG
jgi:hypothetical protein